jgi:hypothetical protein
MAHLSVSQSAYEKLLEPAPYLPPLLSAPTRQEYYSRDFGNEQNVRKESSLGSTVDENCTNHHLLMLFSLHKTLTSPIFLHMPPTMCNSLHRGRNLRLRCLRANRMIGDHPYFFILDSINFQDWKHTLSNTTIFIFILEVHFFIKFWANLTKSDITFKWHVQLFLNFRRFLILSSFYYCIFSNIIKRSKNSLNFGKKILFPTIPY